MLISNCPSYPHAAFKGSMRWVIGLASSMHEGYMILSSKVCFPGP